MPMKIDGMRIPKKYDRRIKLLDDDKKEIRELYATGTTSYNKLAAEYGVSKRLIYWVVNPEKQEENYELLKENGGSKQYYDKETHTECVRRHREYKQQLLKEGKVMKKNIVVLDLEVSPNYFLIGMKLMQTNKVLQIDTKTMLTPDQKKKFIKILTNSTVITFNGARYDMPIIHKVLCDNMTTRDIFEMSKRMIGESMPPYRIYKEFAIDPTQGVDHIDISEPAPGVFVSLKGYGARLHSQKLQDLPYEYDKVLTDKEIEVIKNYNINDLDTTIDLFNAIRPRIDLREKMTEQYGVDLRSKSDAQIAETVIVKELTNAGIRVISPSTPKTVRYKAPSCISFCGPILKQLLKRVQEEDFKINPKNGAVVLPDWLKKYPLEINGTKYQIGIGGLHSKEKKLVCEPEDGYTMRNIDVASYYPSMILEFGFYPPRFTEKFLEVYGNIYKTRLKAKAKKDMVVSDGLKIVLNGSFGKLGSMYSKLYAPDLMLQVTLTGQLMLLMLIEEVTKHGYTVVSSNTDGIELICPKDRTEELENIVFEWELETGMVMEHGEYRALYARDVNNYVAVYDEYAKAKGVYAEPTLQKNSEYPIVFEAIRKHLFDKNISIEDTIMECTDVRQFLTARTVKGGGVWKDEYLGKVVRWYYSTEGATIHYKTNGNKVPKSDGAKPMMDFGNKGYALPYDLDFAKYEELAMKHLEDLGVEYKVESRKHIAMISGGRDSSAMVEHMLSKGMPLDYIIFTDTQHEFPFMYEYLEKFNNYLKKTYNKEITFLSTKTTFKEWVFGTVTRGERKGMIRGLPMLTVPCFWKRESKVKVFDKFLKENNIEKYTQYIGYTYSERKRAQVKDTAQRFPLIEDKLCEFDVDKILQKIGMENKLYDYFSRTGCSMCPYQSEKSLYTLWKNFPDEWKYMVEIEETLLKLDNVVNKTWKIDKTLREFENDFILNKKELTDIPDKACECSV